VIGSLFEYDVHVLHIYHPTQNDASLLREQITQSKKSSPTHHIDSSQHIPNPDDESMFRTEETNDYIDGKALSVLSR